MAGRIYRTATLVGDNANDINGHGTHIAGIIAAIPNNGIGIAGIHPHARLSIYKYSDQPLNLVKRALNRDTILQHAYDIAFLIREAVDNGDEVISISTGVPYDVNLTLGKKAFTFCNPDKPSCRGELRLAVEYAAEHGVVIVAASPEYQKERYKYPAAFAAIYNNVIAVTASTPSDTLAPYSTTGAFITIAAPGGAGTSCLGGEDDCILSLGLDGSYAENQGTSMAAPHVTGVVALMLSANSTLQPADIKFIITDTATDFATLPDGSAGAGIINAKVAVLAAMQR